MSLYTSPSFQVGGHSRVPGTPSKGATKSPGLASIPSGRQPSPDSLAEYRNPLRYASIDVAAGERWRGVRMGTKTEQYCTDCHGRGSQTCPACRSGRVSCRSQEACPYCSTAGCPHCSHTGYVHCQQRRDPGWRPCPNCQRSGGVACRRSLGERRTVRFVGGELTRRRRRFQVTTAETALRFPPTNRFSVDSTVSTFTTCPPTFSRVSASICARN